MDFDQAEAWRRLNCTGRQHEIYNVKPGPDNPRFRQYLGNLLHKNLVTVEFIKKDGTTRAMICTLSPDHGAKYSFMTEPAAVITKPRRQRSHEQVRTVWDCEAGAWRSFRWDRLTKIGFTVE